jgi:hypothetical protein
MVHMSGNSWMHTSELLFYRIRMSYCHVGLFARVPNNSFWANKKITELSTNLSALVSTTNVIFNLLSSLTDYQNARGWNLYDVVKALVAVPQSCTDGYWYTTRFFQVTVCRMSSNNIAIILFSLALQSSAGYGILVSRGFFITHNDAPQSVGLLWMSDQLVAENSTWQHTTHTQNRQWHSNPRSQ